MFKIFQVHFLSSLSRFFSPCVLKEALFLSGELSIRKQGLDSGMIISECVTKHCTALSLVLIMIALLSQGHVDISEACLLGAIPHLVLPGSSFNTGYYLNHFFFFPNAEQTTFMWLLVREQCRILPLFQAQYPCWGHMARSGD